MNTQFEYFTVDYTPDPPPPWVDVDGVMMPQWGEFGRTWTPILFEGKREWPEAQVKDMLSMNKPGWYRFTGYGWAEDHSWHQRGKSLVPIPFNDLEIKA